VAYYSFIPTIWGIDIISTRLETADVNWKLELKLVVAAIYTNYTTMIVDDEDIEPMDGYLGGPKGNKLILNFMKA